MNAFPSTHKPGDRLPELTPFELGPELGQDRNPAEPRLPLPGSAYGCVEWFQYLDHPTATPAIAPRPQDGR